MLDFLFVKVDKDFTRISYSDIIYIEGLKNYVKIVTTKSSYIILVTMKQAVQCLPQDKFCRIHRPYITSLNYILQSKSKCVNIGLRILPISEHHRDVLFEKVIMLNADPETSQTSPGSDKIEISSFLLANFR
jgi:hypothetical protein